MELRFTTEFKNSIGMDVAGTWQETDSGQWRLSTIPLRVFASEREAITFFHGFCDPETGLQIRSPRMLREPLQSLAREVNRGTELKQTGEALLVEVQKAIEIQRQHAQRLRRTLSKSGAARPKANPG